MSKIERALQALNSLIADGAEFPDVTFSVARRHGVRQTELERAYDDEQERVAEYQDRYANRIDGYDRDDIGESPD